MLPVANLHLREFYDRSIEFFALRSPTLSARGQTSEGSGTVTPVSDPVARLTRECVSLREKLEAADSRQSSTTSACPQCGSTVAGTSPPQPLSGMSQLYPMRRELDDTKKELARTKLEMSRLEDRCRALERALREAKRMLKARDSEIESLSRSPSKSPSNGRIPHRMAQNGDDEDDDVSDIESVLTQMEEEETEEDRAKRKGEELFMTRTDSWSGAQVVQAVHDLNSEILQFSAAATEMCTFQKKLQLPSSTRFVQASKDTATRLGQNMARVLSSREHSQDPMLVQFALQGCLSICIARALKSFCLGFPSKNDAVLTQIYSHMYAAVPQPTSSRWRALTHQYIHAMYPYLLDYSVNELAETMYRWCADVFVISGCRPTSDGNNFATRDGLRARFGDKVSRLARTVTRLGQVMREEIMSTNFEVLAVEQGEKYDPQRMTDAFADYGSSRGDILTTTELGLRCITKVGRESSRKEERRLLVRPKIVLDSVLQFMDPR